MIWKNNRLADIKAIYHEQLTSIFGSDEALQMLNILIDKYFKLSRADQVMQSDFSLTESEMLKLHWAVKDLLKNKPIQYILGETYFLDCLIKVNPSVLIPRPETEELVQLLINENSSGIGLKILDIGTGSGCIPIAVSKNISNADVWAMDVSDKAIETAKQNASLNNVEINFIEDNILAPVSKFNDKFDVIVSNPPYVTQSDKKLMRANVVDYEPSMALFVEDNDALLFYRVIIEFAKENLNNGGRLYFEINENKSEEVVDLLQEACYKDIRPIKDIHEKYRFVCATK